MEQPDVVAGRDEHDNPGPGRGALRSIVAKGVAVSGAPSGPQGDVYRNFGEGFSRAFELAVTPVIFGAGGYALDRWIGTLPVFTIVLALLALVGLLLRVWYGYVYRMEAIERNGPWTDRTAAINDAEGVA